MTALENWLTERRMTQKDLADQLGMNYAWVNKQVSGAQSITPGLKLRFAEKYGVDEAIKIGFIDGSNGHDA